MARPSRTEEEQPDTKGEVRGRGNPRRPPRRSRRQGRGAEPAAARRWGGRRRGKGIAPGAVRYRCPPGPSLPGLRALRRGGAPGPPGSRLSPGSGGVVRRGFPGGLRPREGGGPVPAPPARRRSPRACRSSPPPLPPVPPAPAGSAGYPLPPDGSWPPSGPALPPGAPRSASCPGLPSRKGCPPPLRSPGPHQLGPGPAFPLPPTQHSPTAPFPPCRCALQCNGPQWIPPCPLVPCPPVSLVPFMPHGAPSTRSSRHGF